MKPTRGAVSLLNISQSVSSNGLCTTLGAGDRTSLHFWTSRVGYVWLLYTSSGGQVNLTCWGQKMKIFPQPGVLKVGARNFFSPRPQGYIPELEINYGPGGRVGGRNLIREKTSMISRALGGEPLRPNPSWWAARGEGGPRGDTTWKIIKCNLMNVAKISPKILPYWWIANS